MPAPQSKRKRLAALLSSLKAWPPIVCCSRFQLSGFLSAIFLLFPILLFAAAPSWWTTLGVLNNNEPNDYAAVNQGQLKNIAMAAIAEMDANLPGGAGDILDQLALSLSGTTTASNDFAAVNLGQLKNLAKPFYDRLHEVGYHGAPLRNDQVKYPWENPANPPNDYAMGNIGQAKKLFSFDVTYSSTPGNPLPDWWVHRYFPAATTDPDPNEQIPGDSGLTILEAFELGVDPTNRDTDGDGISDSRDQYPNDPNRSQDVPVTPIAPLDASDNNTDSNSVSLLMLDDDNKAAFAYNEVEESDTNTIVKAWIKGSITSTQTVPTIYDKEYYDPESNDGPYSADIVSVQWLNPANGTAYGILHASDFTAEGEGYDSTGDMAFSCQNGNISRMDAPEPYQIGNHYQGSTSWGYDLTNVTTNGSYAAYGAIVSGTGATQPNTCTPFKVIYTSGTYMVFDKNYPDDFDLATTTVPDNVNINYWDDFTPITANDNGWAIGQDNDNNGAYAVWHGDDQYVEDISDLGSRYPFAINNSNQVLISGTDAQGNYKGGLWENGSIKDIHDDLLPDTYKNQIKTSTQRC